MRIADDGEILTKGPTVFARYWHNAQATAETVTEDGWLHTGDIGELDDEGFLASPAVRRRLIVTAGGKNVAPGPAGGSHPRPPADQPVPGHRRRQAGTWPR